MNYVDQLIIRFPELAPQKDAINLSVKSIIDCYKAGGKVLIAGNGGSSADCEHVSGELLKGFETTRPISNDELEKLSKYIPESDARALQKGIPALPLTSLIGAITAFSNDVCYDLSFAQLVFALAKKEDVVLAISTSGNSKSVTSAAKVAKALGVKTIALTGKTGGELAKVTDITVIAPADATYLVQEYHLPIYHAICAQVEREIFG
ncbi:MAG: SIS domain-containing protein [Clostridia bacterium]|nr:SIS domain-containing protein [Clostridia bacterium]